MIRSRAGIYAQQSVEAFQGLFNLYPTGWAAGYSVRLLDNSYTGPLVNVRRSSDSLEKTFYPDANNELSMSSEDGSGTSLYTWIGSDSGYVETWYDQSGAANHATQTTAANQPLLVNAGSLVTENGKAALDFDGTDDFMVISDFLGSSTLLNAFHVFKPDVVNILQILMAQYAFSGNQRSFSHGLENSNGNAYSFISGDGSATTRIDSTTAFTTTQQLYTWLYDGSQSAADQIDFWKDGASLGTTLVSGSGTSSLFNTGTDILLGAQNTSASPSALFNGKIQESTLRTVSSDRANVESNINTAFTIY